MIEVNQLIWYKMILPKKDAYNAKIINIEEEIPNVTKLATTSAVTTVENIILNILDQVKKAGYDAKISETEKECFTISDYNNFTSNTFGAKITQKRSVNEIFFILLHSISK